MNDTTTAKAAGQLPVALNAAALQWGIAGGGEEAYRKLKLLLPHAPAGVQVVAPQITDAIRQLAAQHRVVQIEEGDWSASRFSSLQLLIVATGNPVVDGKIASEARQQNILVSTAVPGESDFVFPVQPVPGRNGKKPDFEQKTNDQGWKKLTSRLVLAFVLMVIGHIIISYLPLPPIREIEKGIRPYFDTQFLFFILAGFLAQMVDGVLSMGYGVTSATCLMSFGVSPVAMSAAIHTSEIFTTGISGYSHYKFGNVNKKLFRHLVIPGVIGAVFGAVLLVFLGEKYGKWLMPVIAVYAGFLGLKILFKAFGGESTTRKVKRVGWLAGMGGFFDSFGGGGWGPIVTSALIAKGRSPKYTVGSVSLTEFFVTLASAFTFFLTVGVSHWNVVLGLLVGGGIAAPIAARLAGKLPRKTMMIAVGIMVMIWCVRMIIKSW